MAAFINGQTVSPRGAATPVMTVVSVDNVLGNVVCSYAVAGVLVTTQYAQENLQIAGVNPAINLAAPSGLKMPYDPANATNSATGGAQQTF